jgi:hypothetical protein
MTESNREQALLLQKSAKWFLATRKEDLTQAQIEQRAQEMFKQG